MTTHPYAHSNYTLNAADIVGDPITVLHSDRTRSLMTRTASGQFSIRANTPDELNALAVRLATIAGEWLDELAADDIDTEATSGPVRVSADDLDMARTVLESSPGIARRRQWVTP